MHPEFDIQSSINYLLRLIEERYSKYLKPLCSLSSSREALYREAMKIRYVWDVSDEVGDHYWLLEPYFLLKGEFRLAWITHYYLARWPFETDRNHIALLKPFCEQAELIDIIGFWNDVREGRPMLNERLPSFVPDDPGYGEKLLRKYLKPSRQRYPYELAASARYVDMGSSPKYAMSWDAFDSGAALCEIFLAQEKYVEASECLFRIKHPVAVGEPPSHLLEYPRLRHQVPVVNVLECWLNARLEKDPNRQKAFGWMAIYWTVDQLLKASGTDHQMSCTFRTLCEIIGDFDLMGENQGEFYRYFKNLAMLSCETTAKKVMAHPAQMIPFSEMNALTVLECKDIYDEIAAEKAVAKQKPKKKKKAVSGNGSEVEGGADETESTDGKAKDARLF